MKASKIHLLLLLTFAFAANAAQVDVSTARFAAGSWALSNASLGIPHGKTVSGVTSYDVDGTNGFYAVTLEGGGTLFLAADDEIGPVLAFTAESNPDLSAESPLRVLLEKDIRARRGVTAVAMEMAARPGLLAAAAPAKPKSVDKAKAMWSKLTASKPVKSRLDMVSSKDAAVGSADPVETDAISDMRVEPLVKSKWDQDDIGGKPCFNYYDIGGKPCFNYYTPQNLYCGCVATAAAQIMRFWNYPTDDLPAFENTCIVLGAEETLQSVGYPESRHYYWENMTLVPATTASDAERKAIGQLTADIGIALGAEYTTSGTGAMSIDVSKVFRDTFAYPSGVEFWDNNWESALNTGSGLHTRETRNKVIYACLDAGLPVQLAIADGNGYNGHAVVCDGYGFVTIGDVETEFAHINMGWSGTGDMWYNLPEIDSAAGAFAGQGGVDFRIIKGATFNIATESFGELLTGRITDDGTPVSNVTVTAYAAGTETPVDTCVTDEHGIYALRLPGNAKYDVKAVADDGKRKGELDDAVDLAATGGSYDVSDVGNSWGNDIDIAIPYIRVVHGDSTNLFNNLNKALAAAAELDAPRVEIFGPTQLKKAVTIVTNMTICVVANPDSEYPTMEDCTITILDDAVVSEEGGDRDEFALQVAKGVRVAFSNVLFVAESGELPYINVLATGSASVAGKIGIGTVKVQDTDGFVIAGVFESVGAGLSVSYAGATDRYSQFGTYECADDDASACAGFILNALDRTLMGAIDANNPGALIWDRVPVDPSVAIAYATNDVIGTTYYSSLDLVFKDYTNGAEVVILKDCDAGAFTVPVTISSSFTIASTGLTFSVTAASDVGFSVTNGAELVFTNVVFTRSGGGTRSFVTLDDGSFVLDDGAAIEGLSLGGAASAVYVNKGKVTMRDGSAITNCVGTNDREESCGAAVYLKGADCRMDFQGGTITGCQAGHESGAAVYAETGAKVYVSGSASAYGNVTGIYNSKSSDVYVYDNSMLKLAGPMTGNVGVNRGTTAGSSFATIEDGVTPDAAKMACGHFFNDKKPKFVAAVSNDGKTLVWATQQTSPKPVPEADAVARLVLNDASDTYASIDDALEIAGSADARIELLKDTSLVKSLSINGSVVLDGMGHTLTRDGDFCLAVTNSTLTLTNLVMEGAVLSDRWGRILDIYGGSLTLESGTRIYDVCGVDRSMVAPIVVQNGSFLMMSGAEIFDCMNFYESTAAGPLTAGAVLINGQDARAEFRGGTIEDCMTAMSYSYKTNGMEVVTNDLVVVTNYLVETDCLFESAGGVYVGNGAHVRIGGDTKIQGNGFLAGEECNLVVQDKSGLVLADILTGRVGYTEGVSASTNVFGTVDADFAASTTASNLVVSARRFTNDRTAAKGMVATNETETILVWSTAVGDSTQFTNSVNGVVYDVVLVEVDDDDPEIVVCEPYAFAAIEEVSPGKWKLTLKPGTEHCVYTLKSSSDLETWTTVGTKTLSADDINADLEFIFETTPDSGIKRFWKVEGANGTK